MMDVVFLYDCDCPNVSKTRANLIQAFAQAKLAARWREVDRAAIDTPSAWKGYGSPTILIDGVELTGLSEASGAASCRVYGSSDGLSGVPSIELIRTRLLEATEVGSRCPAS